MARSPGAAWPAGYPRDVSAAPRPGWYPDPAGTPELYRWWDGGGWGEAISESPSAPSPRTQVLADPTEEPARRRPSRLRAVVALVVCLALFLSATVGLGLIIWHDPPALRGLPRVAGGAATSAASPAPGAPAVGRLDESSREATIGDARMTLPPAPYALSPEPMQLTGLLDLFFQASAPVHPRYDGVSTWSAAVLLGRLPAMADGEDLQLCARQSVQALAGSSFFLGRPTRLRRVQVADHSVDGERGVRLTASVRYDIARLPSRYDQVTLVLVELDDGTVLAALSSVPDDAPPPVRQLAAASLASLTIR